MMQTLPRLPEKADFKGVCAPSSAVASDSTTAEKGFAAGEESPTDETQFENASELFIDIPEVTIIKIPLALYFGNVAVFKAHCERLVMDSMTAQVSKQPCMVLSEAAVKRLLSYTVT